MRATTKVLSSSSRWVQRSKNDFFSRKSKELGLRSRAGFKLKEINDKFQIFKPKQIQNIVDLGFAPGAWSQICVQCCNGHSKILGVDILPCKPPRGVNSIQANIMSKKTHGLIKEFFGSEGEEFMKQLRKRTEVSRPSSPEVEYEAPLQGYGERSDLPVDVILSDMMANTSGLRIKDHVNSVDLCDAGLILCIDLLRPGGTYVCKIFSGKEDYLMEYRLRKVFNQVVKFKPELLRSESKEFYFIAMDKKNKILTKPEIFGLKQ